MFEVVVEIKKVFLMNHLGVKKYFVDGQILEVV
jgi:hypothetical protein